MFRKELTEKGLFDALFDKFNQHLRDNNLIMNEGIIIDGSFVEVPRQRNSREENKLIKKCVATDASVHDSKPTKQLVDES